MFGQENPEMVIEGSSFALWVPSLKRQELLSESKDLQKQVTPVRAH